MTVPDKHSPPSDVTAAGREDPTARAHRIQELKQQVQSGTYLIQRYEIIEGILDALSRDTD